MNDPVGRGQDRAVQAHSVGLSVEALAAAWSRRDGVANGSVVVVETEIAARRRLGEPWLVPHGDSFAMAMVLRPRIELNDQGLLWLVAALAATRAGAACSDRHLTIAWPDLVHVAGTDSPIGCVNVVTQLGPGRLEHAIVAVRFSMGGLGLKADGRAGLLTSTMAELEWAASLLADDRRRLIDGALERMPFIGRTVKARLLPQGEARGRATAVDPNGRLVLETPTGMLEYLAADALRSIEVI